MGYVRKINNKLQIKFFFDATKPLKYFKIRISTNGLEKINVEFCKYISVNQ